MNPAIQTNGVKPWLLCCVNGGFGQLSFWPSTALLFLATTQTISAKQKHSSSTTRFNLWQLPYLHLQFPIEIWSFDLNAYKRTNTFQPRNISHIDIVDDVCTRKYTKNNSITKTMTRKLCCYLDFIYSLNKSSYKLNVRVVKRTRHKKYIDRLPLWVCCCSSSDSIVESVSELASLS